MANQFLLYGANGYTGRLIARVADSYGLKPVLAGRKKDELSALSSQTGFEYRVIHLEDTSLLRSALKDFSLVLHAAGPFDATAQQMVEACLDTSTHYIDINGDTAVFELIKSYHGSALGKNIMLLPGAGFDVVPTDCTAALLKLHLPDADHLKLAFVTSGGGLSRGTANTMINHFGEGGARRQSGKIIKVPLGEQGLEISIQGKNYFVMSIPWGDVSTAFHTTGIGNIETFTGISKNVYRVLKLQHAFNWILRSSLTKNFLRARLAKRAAGPDDETRNRARSFIWGQVSNAAGRKKTVVSEGPEGYTLTAHSSLIIARKILEGHFKPGYHTPASAYGDGLVLEVPGFTRGEVYDG